MAKLSIRPGSTDVQVRVFIQSSASTVGAGLTGLVYNTSSLTCYYVRDGAAAAQLSLATQTVTGAHSDGGFVEIDATNLPGLYRLDLSDAIVAAGSRSVTVMLKGAANMPPTPLEIDLSTQVDTGYTLKKNTAFSNFEFKMLDSADHLTAKTGLTVTATRSIDGGSFSACANSASEVANGFYKINLADTDLNGNCITLRFTATGADPTEITIITQA